ncbi:Vacuolar protein sorting-associated protein [Echinococcus granulosus]|uniref:Vacuolar protein sorting-associated protein 52 homolog n=1 Tax=Echinococcus granulosus TaxID=6210 RepID=W6V5K2_ECHGR|nr:Vacuolar protein sorting-associated protein [Echinococcus granulosus]EUB61589.1 Vacuolar protein sorting-associated protein [Echinococcus granulosus]
MADTTLSLCCNVPNEVSRCSSGGEMDDIGALSDEVSNIVLESDVDLRIYSKRVEEQLESLESSAVETYVRMGPSVVELHKKISTCCKTLERMETILADFHRDLGNISSDIQDLQIRSMNMHQRLQNRQAVRGELSQFLSDMVIPDALIQHILLTPVTEQEFIENLHELDHKLKMIADQGVSEYPACQDIGSLLKKLKTKAVTRIREFLLEKIKVLRKPMANYQVPQSQLLRFRYFYAFLLIHERELAREVRGSYLFTMEKVYFAYFKTYASKLLKLQADSTLEKDDLVGKKSDELNNWNQNSGPSSVVNVLQSSSATTNQSTSRPGQFGLGGRAERLLTKEGLQAAILLPHAAAKNESKYLMEEVYRSINYALLDTACREYVFLGDFFLHSFSSPVSSSKASLTSEQAAASLFDKVFGRTLGTLETSVMPTLIQVGQYDLLGVLLSIQLTHSMISLMRERGVPVLDRYWFNQLDAMWSRVVDRMEAHIASLRSLDTTQFAHLAALHLRAQRGASINEAAAVANLSPRAYSLIRPHPVARRYAELAASLHTIGSALSVSGASKEGGETVGQVEGHNLDPRVVLALSRMHAEFEAACYRLAKALPRNRLRLVFLINNFDLIVSVLSEKGAGNSPEVNRCREAIGMHTTAYIDQALLPYFGSMINFIQFVEKRGPDETVDQNEEGRVTRIVKGFNIDWKNSIEKINSEIMLEFANFTLGTQIFHALLSQLVQVYHRFQRAMTLPPYKSMPVRNQLVSIHQIMNEIKGFKSNF